ncbi:hypothetical protein OG596_12745 [Streptomyces sp. NBC_01102]|uniref:hypothetical protein n=1 Tax=unclassified Streptomyces TaxID=2593676 RepID=UPI0038650CF2|nr:hypothetical protein OG596_12745 [Streptomyces sp. NBC_01102]
MSGRTQLQIQHRTRSSSARSPRSERADDGTRQIPVRTGSSAPYGPAPTVH